MFIPLVLASASLLTPALQESRPPDPEAVKAAVARLEQAFEKGSPEERLAALQAAAPVADPEVVAWVRKGLADRERSVKGGALEALGAMAHPKALAALHETYKGDKALRKDDELTAKLLKSIGRHASPGSVAILADDPFGNLNHDVIQARILSLGNVRTKDSVEALISMMRLRGPLKVQPYMANFRLALSILTGADQGRSQEAWMAWWNDHKKDLAVSPKPAALPLEEQARWDRYWGREPERGEGRGEDRRKRGGDGDDSEGSSSHD
jgi:hypothetical protein